jgi:hypothetical protein
MFRLFLAIFRLFSNTGDSRYTRFRYPSFRISTVLFQCYEEHQYPVRGQILNPITCVKLSPGLSEYVIQMISLASKNSGARLTSKWRLLYFLVLRVFVTRWDSQECNPPWIRRVNCTLLWNGLLYLPVFNCKLQHTSVVAVKIYISVRLTCLVCLFVCLSDGFFLFLLFKFLAFFFPFFILKFLFS